MNGNFSDIEVVFSLCSIITAKLILEINQQGRVVQEVETKQGWWGQWLQASIGMIFLSTVCEFPSLCVVTSYFVFVTGGWDEDGNGHILQQ